MAKFNLVTLGGVITDPRAGLNYIMSCFFFSKYSQTDLYNDNVISLSKIIKRSGDDPTEIESGIESGLTQLLSRYYDTVQLSVASSDDGANIEVALRGTVTTEDSSGTKRIDLGYVLGSKDGTFNRIIDTLNNETVY